MNNPLEKEIARQTKNGAGIPEIRKTLSERGYDVVTIGRAINRLSPQAAGGKIPFAENAIHLFFHFGWIPLILAATLGQGVITAKMHELTIQEARFTIWIYLAMFIINAAIIRLLILFLEPDNTPSWFAAFCASFILLSAINAALSLAGTWYPSPNILDWLASIPKHLITMAGVSVIFILALLQLMLPLKTTTSGLVFSSIIIANILLAATAY